MAETSEPAGKRNYPLLGFYIAVAVLLGQIVSAVSSGVISRLGLADLILIPLIFILPAISFIMVLTGLRRKETRNLSIATIIILVLSVFAFNAGWMWL
jgi:hypothetical protein